MNNLAIIVSSTRPQRIGGTVTEWVADTLDSHWDLTVLDHAAPPLVPYHSPEGWTSARLASVSRELAVNDDRWFAPLSLLGQPEDRNVELVLRAPFPMG